MKRLGPQDLAREGELMGHCVGGYCRAVEQEYSIIYSLRDSKNEPHVTIELEPENEGYKLIQVQGQGNSEPLPQYKELVRKFFEELQKTSEISISIPEITDR